MTPKNVAIYARVSTTDQSPGLQIHELQEYARRRGCRVVEVVEEYESGVKTDRAGVVRVMDLARKRKIDAILVWKFDRFARSLKQLLTTLEECRAMRELMADRLDEGLCQGN